jgi:hypothetical protein
MGRNFPVVNVQFQNAVNRYRSMRLRPGLCDNSPHFKLEVNGAERLGVQLRPHVTFWSLVASLRYLL